MDKPYGHHGCYLVEEIVSYIQNKAHDQKFNKSGCNSLTKQKEGLKSE